jgi:uncharacterized protein
VTNTVKPRVWLDIDNPPQVQYLLPFAGALRARGAEVLITARDYGDAVDLLAQHSERFHVVGGEFGRYKVAKVWGAMTRALALKSLFDDGTRPVFLLCSSRSSALTARLMNIPSYIVLDYEFANLSFFRLTRSTILYPDVIDVASLLSAGIAADRLVPFRGMKEDISLGAIDVETADPVEFAEISDQEAVRVLFRPPSEQSHYFSAESRRFALCVLKYLADQPHVVVVFSPRHPWQVLDLEPIRWRNEPIVLNQPVPFVPLLKAVDLVVCSGGTMLREAAYLGVPAYSIFKSEIGAVDKHLAAIGRVRIIDSEDELTTLELKRRTGLSPLRTNPNLLDEIVSFLMTREDLSLTS